MRAILQALAPRPGHASGATQGQARFVHAQVHSDPSLGLFLMALWSAAMLLFTWDMASAPTDWEGLAAVHLVMQAILLLAALGTGSAGAAVWIGKPAHA
jgi:hypothetical protein